MHHRVLMHHPSLMHRIVSPMRNAVCLNRSFSNLREALESTKAFPKGSDPEMLRNSMGQIENSELLNQASQSLWGVELGANTPVGWIENSINFLHVNADMSWYALYK